MAKNVLFILVVLSINVFSGEIVIGVYKCPLTLNSEALHSPDTLAPDSVGIYCLKYYNDTGGITDSLLDVTKIKWRIEPFSLSSAYAFTDTLGDTTSFKSLTPNTSYNLVCEYNNSTNHSFDTLQIFIRSGLSIIRGSKIEDIRPKEQRKYTTVYLNGRRTSTKQEMVGRTCQILIQ